MSDKVIRIINKYPAKCYICKAKLPVGVGFAQKFGESKWLASCFSHRDTVSAHLQISGEIKGRKIDTRITDDLIEDEELFYDPDEDDFEI